MQLSLRYPMLLHHGISSALQIIKIQLFYEYKGDWHLGNRNMRWLSGILTNWNTAQVSLQLHEQIVVCHWTIGVHFHQPNVSVVLHCLQNVSCLETNCFKCRPNDMIFCRESSQTANYSICQKKNFIKLYYFYYERIPESTVVTNTHPLASSLQ